MKIYIKYDPKSINHLLDLLFNPNSSRYTLLKTYSDPECTILQCNRGTRRSLNDLWYLVTTYFPQTTPLEFFNAVFGKDLKFYVCNGIGNVVLHYAGNYNIFNKSDIPNVIKHLHNVYSLGNHNVLPLQKQLITEAFPEYAELFMF